MPSSDRKTTAKTVAAQHAAPAKKSSVKVAPDKKPAKKLAKQPDQKVARKATAKTAATNATAKTASATKAPAKTAPATKAPAKKTSAAKKAPALVVLAHEKPWTAKEVAHVRGDLEADRDRLQSEVSAVEQGLHDLLHDAGVGAGNDQADVGSSTLERDAEMSLANNTREMLFQVQRALARLEDGTYGVCESCGNPIGKQRLMAFPRATLCLTCKQREERR